MKACLGFRTEPQAASWNSVGTFGTIYQVDRAKMASSQSEIFFFPLPFLYALKDGRFHKQLNS